MMKADQFIDEVSGRNSLGRNLNVVFHGRALLSQSLCECVMPPNNAPSSPQQAGERSL
jgi:hypothetical protein